MKLSSIFKKETKKSSKANIQKMDSKQLEKVIGGVSSSGTLTEKAPKIDLNP